MSNLNQIKGIGNKNIVLLEKLHISDSKDLINYLPFRYEILLRTNLNDVTDGDRAVVEGKIENNPTIIRFRGNMNKMSFRLNTDENIINIAIFNRAFLKNNLKIGKIVTIIGKLDKLKNTIIASDIRLEPLGNKLKIEPIYHVTSGISNKILNNFIGKALEVEKNNIPDLIPDYILKKYNFKHREDALKIVHNPIDIEQLKKSQIVLKYEELFLFMLRIGYLKQKHKKEIIGLSRDIDMSRIEGFIGMLPFLLTYDQRKAIDEIIRDLKEEIRMNRLLQGDVGSGKTIVAVIAMLANCLSGYQSALMVPTEILAVQHYNSIKELLANQNINIELLVGSLDKNKKKKIYKDLAVGNIDILIGTHAIIQDEVKYSNLGLVITDEQHRFGVNQRANLKNKGITPDVLYMSATPIPRTYALSIYGDMDISIIKTKPSGRKDIITYLKNTKELKEVLQMMYDELQNNHQIYVVAPLIEESENIDLTNINLLRDKMLIAFGKQYSIDILHGKMKSEEKDKVMNNFLQNKINILISTTVVEVGLNIPNATMIVIFDADRFGLSTLHQLRGRVGRSDVQSYCVLISDSEHERLKVMEETNDGFIISEQDFNLRGHGDLFGVKQSGDMVFKIADLKKDFKILIQAKEDADELLNNDLLDTNYDYKNLKGILIKTENID